MAEGGYVRRRPVAARLLAGLTALWVAGQLGLGWWVLSLLERSADPAADEYHHGTRDPRIDDAATASALLLIGAPLVIAVVAATGKRLHAAAAYALLSAALIIPAVDALQVFDAVSRWTG